MSNSQSRKLLLKNSLCSNSLQFPQSIKMFKLTPFSPVTTHDFVIWGRIWCHLLEHSLKIHWFWTHKNSQFLKKWQCSQWTQLFLTCTFFSIYKLLIIYTLYRAYWFIGREREHKCKSCWERELFWAPVIILQYHLTVTTIKRLKLLILHW